MDLLDFVNKYWTILAGIASVIFSIAYNKNDNDNLKKDMKLQKEGHNKDINDLQVKHAATDVKVDNLKDNTFTVISLMQQDIREIMTILKRDK